MMKTLQLYVTRELLKTFALTAVGLTLTFSLCGGVFNMVKAEVLTAVEMVRFLGFVIPVATTLTLPISALFACAIVYGRFAADNEFDACKASGINIHRLLAPAVGLSVVTAAFTFSFSNYVIPKSIEQMEIMVRKDLQKIAVQLLKTQGYVRYGDHVVYAGDSDLFEQDDSDVLRIRQAAFLELDNDTLVRCGTAREVRVDFYADESTGEPMMEAVMTDVRALDIGRRQIYQELRRPFGMKTIPKKLEQDPKWLTLTELLYYREHPTELMTIQEGIVQLRKQVRQNMFFRYVRDELVQDDKVLSLEDDRFRYEVRAEKAWLDEMDFRPELRGVRVVQQWRDDKGSPRRRDYRADECVVEVERNYTTGRDVAILNLKGNVSFVDAIDTSKRIEHSSISLDEVAVPKHVLDQADAIDDATLVGFDLVEKRDITSKRQLDEALSSLGLGDRIHLKRISILIDLVKSKLDIVGIIHSRLAFSVSVLVTLIMASGLGIVFRGGQLLTAFVISFIPGLLVVVMNITGRHLTENTGTHLLGITVIWSGIVLLALADVVILKRYLKR